MSSTASSGEPPQPRPSLRAALSERVVIADGAMGSMLQGIPLTLDDFEGHEGCNEVLNVTRPDVVTGIHDAYLAAGAEAPPVRWRSPSSGCPVSLSTSIWAIIVAT